jgi:hypothetical protein
MRTSPRLFGVVLLSLGCGTSASRVAPQTPVTEAGHGRTAPPPPAAAGPAAPATGSGPALVVLAPTANAASAPLPDTVPIRTFPQLPRLTAADLERKFGDDESYLVHVSAAEPARVVDTCRALLNLPKEVDLESGKEQDYQWFSSREVECLAASLMLSAKPALHSRLDAFFESKDPVRLLPPLLGLTDFADDRRKVESAAGKCSSWKAFDKSVRVKQRDADRFSFQADIWSGEVIYYARADFDGDGYEDLLVRRNGHADQGSFAGSALFLLSMTDKDTCLRVALECGRS